MANVRILSVIAALGLAAISAGAQAQATSVAPYKPRTVPVVIHDAGGTPIGQYLDSITEEGAPGTTRRPPPTVTTVSPSRPIFPVVTTLAKPGRLGAPTKGKLKGGPGVPLCVLGDDALSQQWLRINQTALLQMKATCLVAAVRDEAAWRALQSQAGEVPLTPGSFDALATAMGIAVYPILVSPDGLVSQ
jgi:integrating conjugative element protein (TIGR03765 family)